MPARQTQEEPDFDGHAKGPKDPHELGRQSLRAPDQGRKSVIEPVGALDEAAGDDHDGESSIAQQFRQRAVSSARGRFAWRRIGRQAEP